MQIRLPRGISRNGLILFLLALSQRERTTRRAVAQRRKARIALRASRNATAAERLSPSAPPARSAASSARASASGPSEGPALASGFGAPDPLARSVARNLKCFSMARGWAYSIGIAK